MVKKNLKRKLTVTFFFYISQNDEYQKENEDKVKIGIDQHYLTGLCKCVEARWFFKFLPDPLIFLNSLFSEYLDFCLILKQVINRLKSYRFIMLIVGISLLFSTSGLSIDAHFCSGKLKRIKVFGHAKTCLEVFQLKNNCCSKRKIKNNVLNCAQGSHDKGCCSNESVQLDLDLDFKLQNSSHTDFSIPLVFNSIHHSVLEAPLRIWSASNFLIEKYYPPSRSNPHYILYQSFLC